MMGLSTYLQTHYFHSTLKLSVPFNCAFKKTTVSRNQYYSEKILLLCENMK